MHQKRLVILTNPKLYRIREVGEETKGKREHKQLRSAPAHRSEKERITLMLKEEGFSAETATRAVRARLSNNRRIKKQQERSKRAKNKRVPPKVNNIRKKDTDTEESSSKDTIDSNGSVGSDNSST